MKDTIRIIEEVTGATEKEWLSHCRVRNIVYARYLIAYELQQRHGYTLLMLADYFGKSERFARRLIISARNEMIYNKDFQRMKRQLRAKFSDN